MPANTSSGFPYPLPTEPVAEGAQAIRNLSEAVETRLATYRLFDWTAALGQDFNYPSIPQIYRTLEIVWSGIPDSLAAGNIGLVFNADTTANYAWRASDGPGQTGQTYGGIGRAAQAAPAPSTGRVLIPNYAVAGAWKTYVAECFSIDGGAANQIYIQAFGGAYAGSALAAITRVQIAPISDPGFRAGARFTVYGWK